MTKKNTIVIIMMFILPANPIMIPTTFMWDNDHRLVSRLRFNNADEEKNAFAKRMMTW